MAVPDYQIPPWLIPSQSVAHVAGQQALQYQEQGQSMANQIQNQNIKKQQLAMDQANEDRQQDTYEAQAKFALKRQLAEQNRQKAISDAQTKFAKDPASMAQAIMMANVQFGNEAGIGSPAMGASVKALEPPKPTQPPVPGTMPNPGGGPSIPYMNSGGRITYPPAGLVRPSAPQRPTVTKPGDVVLQDGKPVYTNTQPRSVSGEGKMSDIDKMKLQHYLSERSKLETDDKIFGAENKANHAEALEKANAAIDQIEQKYSTPNKSDASSALPMPSDKAALKKGQVYATPRGEATWDGEKFTQ